MREPNQTIERLKYFARVGGWFIGKAKPRWMKTLVGVGVHIVVVLVLAQWLLGVPF